MELQTMVLAGKEYVLVPIEFMPDAPVVSEEPEKHPVPLEIATKEEQRESIRVVDPGETGKAKPATPKVYGYQERFLKKQILPTDISIVQRNTDLIKDFQEDSFIKSMDWGNTIPPGKSGFYGPGVEVDHG
jgi:hypothetical protein